MILLMIACGDSAHCATGTTLTDGRCVADGSHSKPSHTAGTDTDVPIEDELGDLVFPACEYIQDRGSWNIFTGCADGGCVGDRYNDFLAVWEGSPDCTDHKGSVWCSWGALEVAFLGDSLPPLDGSKSTSLFVQAPYDGGTDQGLGIGVGMHCFVEALAAPPDEYIIYVDDGVASVGDLYFEDLGLFVHDWFGEDGSPGGDGKADNILMIGR